MKYEVDYSSKAARQLDKMDKPTATLIYTWIEKHLVGCADPRAHGKPLTGDKKGRWRYRVGSYRLIAEIRDNILRIIFINIGHRRDVYL